MGHRRRIIVPGGTYHVVNRGVARQTVFFCDADRVEFGRLLAEVWERYGVEVHAYCLMGNHYHLLVRCSQANLSEAMQHLASVFTRHVNGRLDRDGPLFRGRFQSIEVDSPEYLIRSVRYIHRNPLDLPGVTSPDRYRWSSHRAYLGLKQTPDFLDTDRVLSMFGGDRQRFASFVACSSSPVVRTGVDDVRYARSLVGFAVHVAADLIEVVDDGAVDDDAVDGIDADGRPSGASLERTVLLLVALRIGGPLGDRLIDSLQFVNAAARRNASSRARRRSERNPLVDAAVDLVMREVVGTRDVA